MKSSVTPQAVKAKSEKRLALLDVPINRHLPLFEHPSALRLRPSRDIAGRAFAMSYLVALGFSASGTDTLARIERAGLAEFLSPADQSMLIREDLSAEDREAALALGEAVLACAWSLGLIEFNPLDVAPDSLAGLFLEHGIVPGDRIESGVIRPFDEIYEEADFHYRLHWAVRSWRAPVGIGSVTEHTVRPRRHALDWILGVEKEWDDISLDT